MFDMRRRDFITLLGGAAAAWPLAARAQQPAMPVVGFLNSTSPNTFADRLRGFHRGLKETGYVEGDNVTIVYRWAENQIDRLPALVAELVRRPVAVIATMGGAPSALAAKAATTTIPIVFAVAEDPVRLGLVASLARPGGNLTGINYFSGELTAKRLELLRELVPAATLIAMQPDVIFSQNTPTTATLHQQTQTIPIVFVLVSDPIGGGFVTSFSRPGGNITGFISMEATVAGKWLGLLKEIAPHITRAIFLFNPTTAPYFGLYLDPLKAAAPSYGVEVVLAPVRDASELETVIAANAREPNGGLIAMSDAFLNVYRKEVTSLAARYRLPAIYPYHYFFEVGGLMYYGPEMVDQYRRAASYVSRILKGEKPAELPVQAPTKYVLAINAKTAKALGLAVPAMLLGRADEVIE